MFDNYGTKQVYLVQPVRVDYSIPYSDAVMHINEYIYIELMMSEMKQVQ